MLWKSDHQSASDFTRSVHADADFTFVTAWDNRRALSVSGALEMDPDMTVMGPDRAWRVHVLRHGRAVRTTVVRIPKPSAHKYKNHGRFTSPNFKN